MKLKTRYELVVEYELPDGSYTSIDNIINFFLSDNIEIIEILEDNINNNYIFLDDSPYGILQTMYNHITIWNYIPTIHSIRNIGLINNDLKIIKHKELLKLLEKMYGDAVELHNNKESYIRESKLNMIIDGV